MKFYPYEKGGAEKVLDVLKGGHKKFCGCFYTVESIFKGGGHEKFPLLKREGGGRKV